jgi:hypothetical protein
MVGVGAPTAIAGAATAANGVAATAAGYGTLINAMSMSDESAGGGGTQHADPASGTGSTKIPSSQTPSGQGPGVSASPRAGSALKSDPHHAFPDVVDNFAGSAKQFQIPTRGPGGTVVRHSELYQVEGSLNGRNGVFEWIVDQGNMTHRRFIPGGTITGYPNQIPGR